MTLPASRFLDPAALAGVRNLQLVARHVVEGFLSGLHADPRPSTGVEFHQFRAYEPGDDLRRVDWRAHARTDRFHVRESQVERDIVVRFVLDASASMGHRDGDLSKFDYARMLIACLAYLVDRQGDRVSLHAVREPGFQELPASRRQRRLPLLLEFLEHLSPQGRWPGPERLGRRLAPRDGREMLVVVTDLHQRAEEIVSALAVVRALGREVLLFQLMAPDEMAFTYQGDVLFEDLETGDLVRGNADEMRAGYLARLSADLEGRRRRLQDLGIEHELLVIDRPLEAALRTFLVRRGRAA